MGSYCTVASHRCQGDEDHVLTVSLIGAESSKFALGVSPAVTTLAATRSTLSLEALPSRPSTVQPSLRRHPGCLTAVGRPLRSGAHPPGSDHHRGRPVGVAARTRRGASTVRQTEGMAWIPSCEAHSAASCSDRRCWLLAIESMDPLVRSDVVTTGLRRIASATVGAPTRIRTPFGKTVSPERRGLAVRATADDRRGSNHGAGQLPPHPHHPRRERRRRVVLRTEVLMRFWSCRSTRVSSGSTSSTPEHVGIGPT